MIFRVRFLCLMMSVVVVTGRLSSEWIVFAVPSAPAIPTPAGELMSCEARSHGYRW